MNITPYERKALYYETDQMAIIHHSNYIRWFEEARIDFMEKMGFSYRRMEDEGVIIPVVSVFCEYKAMVKFADTVIITPKITEYTGTRLTISYEIHEKETNKLVTTGESKHCFLSKDKKISSLKKLLPQAHSCFLEAIK